MGLFLKRRKYDGQLPVIDEDAGEEIRNGLYEGFMGLRRAYDTSLRVPGLIRHLGENLIPSILPSVMTHDMDGALEKLLSDPVMGTHLHKVIEKIKENF